MKKLMLWVMLLFACPLIFAQNLQVTENTYQKVSVSFTTDTLLVEDVSIPEGVFSMITIPDYGPSNNPGAPQLPLLTKMLQIPVCDSVVATVVNAQYTEYDASHFGITHPLYPSQPSVSKSTYPQFTYNQVVYNTNDFYALPLVSVEKAGIRRDMVLANIYVSPVQYNPVTQRIRVYSRIDVEFTFVNTNMAATNKLAKYASPMFELDNRMVVNVKSNTAKGPEFTHVPIKYLIIANSMFRNNSDLESFVQWKRRLGYLVEVAYTSDSNVGTTTTSIKNFIQNKYNSATTAEPAPTFLLLIGDVGQIPAFNSQCSSNNPANDHVTDLYYATLTGNDNIPDCYYGRLSATTQAHLTNQLAKIMMYEQYTMPDPSYLGKAVLIAGTDVSESTPRYSATHADGQINYIYNYYINESSTSHNYTQVYKHNFYCSNYASTIRSEIGAGVGLANYTAHGYDNEWSNPEFTASQVSSMTNTGKYGLMIGNCCLSGKFNTTQYNECFGEALLRAANKGAMGYIGASNSSYWDEDVYWAVGVRSSITANMSYSSSALGAYDRMFHTHNEAHSEWVSTIGGMIHGGNLSVQSSSSDIKKYYWEIYHCFGDPSVRVYLGIPSEMNVTADAIIPESNTSYTVQVAPYAYVALKKNSTEFIAAAFANASGSATLTFSESLELGTYELVVLAQNYIPYFQTVEVEAEGSCPTPSAMTVSDVTAFTANLSWTGGSAPFNIELKADNGNWTSVATNVNATNYTLNNLSDNTDYSVRVQSVCSGENSSWRTRSFSTPVACPIPTNLTCGAYTATTANLSWTENGSATNWVIQYGTNSSFASGTYTQVTVSGTTSKTLTGLTAEATYYARVKANCGGAYGQSQWSEVCTFMPSSQTTECEDFESYTGTAYNSAGVLPTGWDVIFTGSSSVYSPHVATGIYNDGIISSGNGFCFTSGNSTYGTNNYAILPAYEGILRNISFKYRYENASYGTLYLGYITDINNANTFVSLQTVPASTTQGTEVSYNLTESNIPDNARLAFKWSHNSSYYTCGIDDICLTGVRIPVTCPTPTALSCTELTATSATLEWTENGAATSWVLQYGTTNTFADGTYTEMNIGSTPQANLTSLTSETEYYARVKAVCDAEDESNWTNICTFTPSNKVVIGSGATVDNCLPTHNYYNYSLTQQIYTAEELGEAGNIQSIDFYKNYTVECVRNLDIYMVSTNKNSFSSGSDWITVTSADLVFSGSVSFADYDWTTIVLDNAFEYDGTNNVAIIVDDNTGSYVTNTPFLAFTASSQAICIYSDGTNYDPASPASYSGTVENKKNHIRLLKVASTVEMCENPTSVTASDITENTATISWTENGTATAWQLCLNGDENRYIDVTENPYILTNLTEGTSYTVKVRANCGNNQSEWSEEISFTTEAVPCTAITLGRNNPSWTEDFENMMPEDMNTGVETAYSPRCWTWNILQEISDNNEPELYRDFAHSGNYCLRMRKQGIYATPEIEIENIRNIREVKMCFWLSIPQEQYTVEVGIANDLNNLSDYTPVAEVISRTTNVVKFKCDFSGYVDPTNGAGPYYVVFKNKSQLDGDNSIIYLDDITLSLEEIDVCMGMTIPYFESFEDYTVPNNSMVIEPDCWKLARKDVNKFKNKPQLFKGYAHDGENSLRMKDRCIYAMPKIDGSVDVRDLKMSMYLRQPSSVYRLQVGIMTNLSNVNTFVPVMTINNRSTGVEYVEIDFSGYEGQLPANGYYIVFRNTLKSGSNLDYSYNYIDEIRLDYSECVVTSLPYTESFETYITTEPAASATEIQPDCWELVSCVSESASTKPQIFKGYAEDGSYSLRLKNLSVYAMPRLASFVDLSNAKMEFYLRQPKSVYTLEVGLMSDLSDMNTYQRVKRFNNSTTDKQHVVVDFSTFNGDLSGRYIVFKNTLVQGANLDYSYNYIDAINLYEIGTTAAGAANGENVTAESEAYSNAPKGIEDNVALSSLTIYPNPTTGTLNLSGIAQRVEVYSQIGSLMAVYENVNQLNISNLAEGIYFLRVTMPEGVAVRKVVKR